MAQRQETGTGDLPGAMERLEEIGRLLRGVSAAVFLDYDGTLTPIVPRPEGAVMEPAVQRLLLDLSTLCPVAVISGRDRSDLQARVGIEGIALAGCHGFDIAAPDGGEFRPGRAYLPQLDRAEAELGRRLGAVPGVQIERKRFAIAVHYRQAAEEETRVEEEVDRVLAGIPGLRRTEGRKVFELQPDIDWGKGKAVRWLLERLGLDGPEVLPIYIGDDLTDEDAFRELRGWGLGIVVRGSPRPTAATYALEPEQVEGFLKTLAGLLKRQA